MDLREQNDQFYRFQIGTFECLSVSDGSFDYDPAHLFPKMSDEKLRDLLKEFHLRGNKIVSPYTFLYVDTGEHKILVDMGAGKLGPNTGKLVTNLRAAGIQPEKIDTVIITHAHPDHIGGTLDEAGKPNYPNAQYYIWQKEWDFWFSDEAVKEVEENLSGIVPTEVFMNIARGQLGPIRDRIKFIKEQSEVLPGVSVVFAPGHTPGHMIVSFTSKGQELLFTSDTAVFPIFLERPELEMIIDISVTDAYESKKKVFDLAMRQNALVLAQHFHPFPGLGHILKKDIGWKWQPIVVMDVV
jgi:glyoxylase-like metal-dependent hydrolase (beta-lactamase superfamily II)